MALVWDLFVFLVLVAVGLGVLNLPAARARTASLAGQEQAVGPWPLGGNQGRLRLPPQAVRAAGPTSTRPRR
jgi:hypothetical protein